jgi:hypothetical protein
MPHDQNSVRRNMKLGRNLLYIVIALLLSSPVYATGGRAEFDAQVNDAVAKLSREAAMDSEGALRLAGLLQSEFGTSVEDMKWAVENGLSWGDITAFSYIRATTGRKFEEIAGANAQRDMWDYTERAGMNSEKMIHSLEQLLKRAQKERNSRIFEHLRGTRKITRLPDLGSGFGLFQEALDFRHIDSPQPDKVHTTSPGLAKGDK